MRVSEEVTRLHGAAVPAKVHRALKIMAAERGVTLSHLVADLIVNHPSVVDLVERRFGGKKEPWQTTKET